MKIPRLPRNVRGARTEGFTLIELLVVISIIAILAGFAMPVFSNAQKNGRITDTLNNAKQTSTALKMYAGDHDGTYPYLKDPDDAAAVLASSNEAFEVLMPRYSSSKTIFANRNSAWCKGAAPVAADATNQYKVLAGQCDWAYVTGLSETSDSRWPLMATAFAPGTKTYMKATSAKGGVWGATDAVVVLVDHSAKKIGELYKSGEDGAYIKRPDKPTSNMFEPADDWLAGDTVKILEPLGGA
jgi:prepilin-type N-terminal cleavage/methylation domain-containing protein